MNDDAPLIVGSDNNGHKLVRDRHDRFTCTECGNAALTQGAYWYGSAVEARCAESKEVGTP